MTVAAFFIAEMGDKTQVATVVLAAKFASLAAVVFGTTLGMLVANVPVVLIGNAASAKIPFKAVRASQPRSCSRHSASTRSRAGAGRRGDDGHRGGRRARKPLR